MGIFAIEGNLRASFSYLPLHPGGSTCKLRLSVCFASAALAVACVWRRPVSYLSLSFIVVLALHQQSLLHFNKWYLSLLCVCVCVHCIHFIELFSRVKVTKLLWETFSRAGLLEVLIRAVERSLDKGVCTEARQHGFVCIAIFRRLRHSTVLQRNGKLKNGTENVAIKDEAEGSLRSLEAGSVCIKQNNWKQPYPVRLHQKDSTSVLSSLVILVRVVCCRILLQFEGRGYISL